DENRLKQRIQGAEPISSVAEELDAHSEMLVKARGKEFLGLPQRTIAKLDEATLGLRGLILLAAPPNIGKTTLATQIGMDIVKNNPDACFLFLSLEMSRFEILTR